MAQYNFSWNFMFIIYYHVPKAKQSFKPFKTEPEHELTKKNLIAFFLQDPPQWNSFDYSSLLLASEPSRHLPDFSNDGPGPARHPRPGLTPSPPVGIHTGNWYNVSASNNGTSTFQQGELVLRGDNRTNKDSFIHQTYL